MLQIMSQIFYIVTEYHEMIFIIDLYSMTM